MSDNGEGISIEERDKLFRAFSQLHGERPQAAKGSGLGLYICYQIAHRMGGRIGVESHRTASQRIASRGSLFYVEVPLLVMQADLAAAVAAAEEDGDYATGALPQSTLRVQAGTGEASSEESGPPPRGIARRSSSTPLPPVAVDLVLAEAPPNQGDLPPRATARLSATEPLPPCTTILVCDDDAPTRMFMSRTLQRMNPLCSVVTAENGSVALAAVATDVAKIDIVCMDNEMPIMDGPTAVRAMRELGFRGVLVGVTGALLPHEVTTFLESGADTVVQKPVNLLALQREMRTRMLQLRDRGGVGTSE